METVSFQYLTLKGFQRHMNTFDMFHFPFVCFSTDAAWYARTRYKWSVEAFNVNVSSIWFERLHFYVLVNGHLYVRSLNILNSSIVEQNPHTFYQILSFNSDERANSCPLTNVNYSTHPHFAPCQFGFLLVIHLI